MTQLPELTQEQKGQAWDELNRMIKHLEEKDPIKGKVISEILSTVMKAAQLLVMLGLNKSGG